jgi:hypothetical protein
MASMHAITLGGIFGTGNLKKMDAAIRLGVTLFVAVMSIVAAARKRTGWMWRA